MIWYSCHFLGATITCQEANRSSDFPLTIFAVPCNGVHECVNHEDEICRIQPEIWFAIPIAIYIILFVAIQILNCVARNVARKYSLEDANTEEPLNRRIMEDGQKGNALAFLKVVFYSYYS